MLDISEISMIQRILALIMLGRCAYTDMKRRIVVMPYVWACLLISLLFYLVCGDIGALGILLRTLPGLILFLISRLSKGRLGEGDAYVFIVLGIMLGLGSIIVLAIGLILSAVSGLIFIFVGHKDKNFNMPFIPFILAGYIILLCIN